MQNRMEIEIMDGMKLVCEKDSAGDQFNLFLEDADKKLIQDLVLVGPDYISQEVDGEVSDEDFISVRVYTNEGSNTPDVEHMLQIIER